MRDNKQNEIEANQSLHGKVFEQLKDSILNGKYKHGDLLNEVKLAEEMGVSRTPVREALRQLELEGLVAYIPNKGVTVRGLSREDIKDIYQIRLMIEGMTARRAAENITEEELAELKEYIELEEFYTGRDDVKQLSRLDSCFHETIYKACGSRLLTKTLKAFHHYAKSVRDISLSYHERAKKTYLEHKAIYEAIRDRDRELAEILMEQHVRNATAFMEKQSLVEDNN
ncbi:MAG TPA: GntR family transcriptional regulator [Clostridia bacterium]